MDLGFEKERSIVFNSKTRVLLGLVLLLGIMLSAIRFWAADQNAPPMNKRKPHIVNAAIPAGRANPNHVYRGGAPADSAGPSVMYFDSKKVAETFTKASLLYDGDGGKENFRVQANHRDKAGEVEIHILDTDVMYVVKGTATQVTGGTIVNSHTIRPNELRGTSIEGGETRQVSPGDLIIIPKGIPHWFKEVPGTFQYLVIKIH